MFNYILIEILVYIVLLQQYLGKIHNEVSCGNDVMLVKLRNLPENSFTYLDSLKYYPETSCKPAVLDDGAVLFNLSLSNIHECGVTKITSINGFVRYYHHILVEKQEDANFKDVIKVVCTENKITPDTDNENIAEYFKNSSRADGVIHNIVRRNSLPSSFSEQDDIEVEQTVEKNAPEPTLHVEVRQGTTIVNGEVNVKPGTPLSMEISLDKESAKIYGILVSYMHVTDTKSQDEAIIFNGCSVNPSLFENFNTVGGDLLTARFRAFKFPDSTYVQFIGTVNVCFDRCRGVECSNGYSGYGRRKRETPKALQDPKKVFEISLTTFIKVSYN